METPFDTYIVPISGIDFIKYMAFYSVLGSYKDDDFNVIIKPKTIFCASGGCLISYLAMMSSFTETIEYWKLSNRLFVFKPLEIMPRMINFAIFGSMYKRPDISAYVKKHFVENKLKDVEIITGFYSNKEGKAYISSNFSETESSLKQSDLNIFGMKAEWLNGNFDDILKRIEYTTNIPIMLKPLDDLKNVDFGVISPSPCAYFSQHIKRSIYFSPINIEKISSKSFRQFLFEKNVMFELSFIFSRFKNFKGFKTINDVVKFLIELNAETSDATLSYCLVIYTGYEVELDIANFDPEQVYNKIQRIKNDMRFRLYF